MHQFLSLLVHTFSVTSRKLCLTQGHKDFLPFSFTSFIIGGFTFKSMIHFELVFVYGERYEVHSFAFGSPVVPAPFIEKTFLSPLYYLCTFAEKTLVLYTCVYFWTFYSVPWIYLSIFMFLKIKKCTIKENKNISI